MKYTALKNTDRRLFTVPSLDGGLVLDKDFQGLEDNQLSDGLNMWFRGGLLRTRSGLKPIEDTVITPKADEDVDMAFRITDSVYYKGNTKYNLAYYTAVNQEKTANRIYFYLISALGELKSIGKLEFSRVVSGYFCLVRNIFFIVGNKTVGSGIYAFISKRDGSNTTYQVFEADEALKNWENVSQQYYCPTYYINGRGTRYAEAAQMDKIKYDEPMFLEQRNLLNSRLKLYYTSDGLSSVFRLPISNLDGEEISCRLYIDSENYVYWRTTATGNTATATYKSKEIKMKCDRKAGVISFTADGEDYPVPIMPYCSSNNIVISVAKAVENGFQRVVSSKKCLIFNSRAYVCGNESNPNEVYSARLTNPLYFPKNMKAIIGENTSAVEALGVQSNKLIAFKANEIYKIDVTSDESEQSSAILDSTSDFLSSDILKAQSIHTDIGCDCPNSIKLCGNRLVWLNADGAVYTLATTSYGDENNVYEISRPIGQKIRELSKDALKSAFAVAFGGYYLLFAGNSVFVLDYNVKGFGFSAEYAYARENSKGVNWHCWRLPEDVLLSSGIFAGEQIIVACEDTRAYINYISSLEGDRDYLLTLKNGRVAKETADINAYFKTKCFGLELPQGQKRIEALYINACGADAIIKIFGKDTGEYQVALKSNLSAVKIIPRINKTDKIYVEASVGGGFALSDFSIEYSKLG